jgi:NAD(P)-dependent dehydrogenase (short-subunit alcohol dehydrogenase family)
MSNDGGVSIFRLDGKTVVVTGASGFLGRRFVRGFLDAGARVIALGRSESRLALLKPLQDEVSPERLDVRQVDFSDPEALDATFTHIADTEPVHVLVNNAYNLSPSTGFNTPSGRLESASREQWAASFDAGIYWAVRATQLLGAQMQKQGGGSIINVSSMYGLVSPDPHLYQGTDFFNPPTYSVAKAGLLAFTRYVAAFWGSQNVRCNALVPGPFSNTEETTANAVPADDPFLKRLVDRTALGRVGRPEELVGALLFLASSASSYMTGQSLVVDGGWTIT